MIGNAIDSPTEAARTVLAFMLKPLMGGEPFVSRIFPILKADFLYECLIETIKIKTALLIIGLVFTRVVTNFLFSCCMTRCIYLKISVIIG